MFQFMNYVYLLLLIHLLLLLLLIHSQTFVFIILELGQCYRQESDLIQTAFAQKRASISCMKLFPGLKVILPAGSMTSSNYSTTSTCTNQSGDVHNLTLTLEESKFDLSALETSTQSLLDDETSPADSLISSTSTSDSNTDLHVERDLPSISSAYQTARTRTPDPGDRVDGEMLQPVKEVM